MALKRKGRNKSGQIWHDEESLYPVLHVTNSLKDYQKELTGLRGIFYQYQQRGRTVCAGEGRYRRYGFGDAG